MPHAALPAFLLRFSTGSRLAICLGIGIAGGAASAFAGWGFTSLAVGWWLFCGLMMGWVWTIVGRMDAAQTAAAAQREDPSRRASGILTVAAALSSMIAVLAFIIISATSGTEMTVLGALAMAGTVALSWLLLQTEFTLRYTHLYYSPGPDGRPSGGLDFNQSDPPCYLDFAYYAFTIGMTYQTADVDVTDSRIRAVGLRHALIAFLFGAVIVAATVNLVAGIGSSLA